MKQMELQTVSVKRSAVLPYLGYGPDAHPGPETVQRLEALISRIPETGPARGAFREVPISGIKKEGVETPYGFVASRRLAKISRNAGALAFGLVTLGENFDRKADQCPDMVDGCLWDAIGTALAEEGVKRLLAEIEADTGQRLSLPFSPGYCDWDLSGQATVFSAFAPSPLGIRLSSDTFVMMPRKSVSFVTCTDIPEKSKNPCRYCNLKNCFMRRGGEIPV